MTSFPEFEAAPPSKTTGQPPGLYVLFGAEMWERFSYYGMRALLVLYLTKHLDYARSDALALYALYTGLAYFTPLIGGYMADKVLGQRKAILSGGILMALGHFAMAFEHLLLLALSLLIIGNGFFKPNISTMVGNLYPQGDNRRDVAYTIFYMGINLGAFIAPLVCGWLGENPRYGWHYGFAAAGVGMVLGLISFLSFQGLLRGGYPPGREEAGKANLVVMDWVHIALTVATCAGLAFLFSLLLPSLQPVADRIMMVIALVFLGALVFVFSKAIATRTSEAGEYWQRISVILIVSVFSIVFWMGFEQSGGTLNLFADAKTERNILGWQFPASFFQSINPLLIVLLAPVVALIWSLIEKTRFRITSSAKMGLGLVILGLAFVVMNEAEKLAGTNGKVGPQWLSAVFLLLTLGELCLSPIGLSLVNKLAPAPVASLMMAVWFLCTAVANYLAGRLEHLLAVFSQWYDVEINLWVFLIASSIIPGLMLLALTGPLKKMAHGRL
ncbi:peptide MFS transporter [Tundrisphaera lichenicola]|uniref:peptide MFS transporter n=1 Tax=Tundrisphaera lichenicola TaxID=2029860 RepID=UPI003EBD8D1C